MLNTDLYLGEPSQHRMVSYTEEIKLMMYGFGDCHRPLDSTAVLVELVVLNQLERLVVHAEEIARDMRDQTILGPEDILFLMRGNECALKRLMTYLGLKDEKVIMCKALPELVDFDEKHKLIIEDEPPAPGQWTKSRKGYCVEFLKSIGIEESDLNMVDDVVKERRQIRANNRSLDLSAKEYEEYHAARCTSFSSARLSSKKFHEWLSNGGIKQTLTVPVIEILLYLAQEVVANIVDMAIILREESPYQSMDSPITPEEIQEVVRRCTYQHSLPFAAFSRDLPSTAGSKVFAL